MKPLAFKPSGAIILLAALILITGCSTAYYAAMEKIGKEKRHLLKDNVQDVQESQTKAQEEFKDALTRIKELYNFEGGGSGGLLQPSEVQLRGLRTEGCPDRKTDLFSRNRCRGPVQRMGCGNQPDQ